MRRFGTKLFSSLIILAMLGTTLRAQNSAGEQQLLPDETDTKQLNNADNFTESRVGFSLLKNIALDQKTIWTSPFHLRWADGTWFLPFATVTALSVATDRSFVHSLSSDPQKLSRYRGFSNDGLGALVGLGVGSYVWSYISCIDEHQRETGILAGEAVTDRQLLTAHSTCNLSSTHLVGSDPTSDQGAA